MENENHEEEMKGGGKSNTEFYVQLFLIGALVFLLAFNLVKGDNSGPTGLITGIETISVSSVIPIGVPEIYGKSLEMSYDDISPNNPKLADKTIEKLSKYEDMELSKELMERYVKIGSSISCEYCCGAKTLVFSNGERACGCGHSFAMRGLAKYLLTEYPEMSDLEILSEMGKLKVLFYPGIHEGKAQVLETNGIDSKNYINLASNLYRGIEKVQSGGGASKTLDTAGWTENEKMMYEMHGEVPSRIGKGGTPSSSSGMVGGC